MTKNATKIKKNKPVDAIDRRILNILAENARTKLTKISKEIGISVDSTKKRMDKLEKRGAITRYTIQIDTKEFGLDLGIHIYLKFTNLTKERFDAFISDMMKNPRVIDLMSVLGDYDMYVVMLAKDAQELEKMKLEIKEKFMDIIADWKEVLVTKLYKLEEYKF